VTRNLALYAVALQTLFFQGQSDGRFKQPEQSPQHFTSPATEYAETSRARKRTSETYDETGACVQVMSLILVLICQNTNFKEGY